jgi:hypothetical protein
MTRTPIRHLWFAAADTVKTKMVATSPCDARKR